MLRVGVLKIFYDVRKRKCVNLHAESLILHFEIPEVKTNLVLLKMLR